VAEKRRREFLRSLTGWSLVSLAGPWAVSAAHATSDGFRLVANGYGVSREQRSLVDFSLGQASRTALIVGGIHAGSEANTVALVQQLANAIEQDSSFIPPALGLTFLSAANPDGLANGTRMLSDGVDPNRNWPTADWSIDTYVSGPTRVPGGGGPFPLSEPETQSLASLVTQLRPPLIVSYHSAAGLVTGGRQSRAMGLEAVYADVAGYAAGDWTAYPVTGDFAQWAEQTQAIPTVDVELPDHASTHLEANLAALRAVLWKL
jgi:murein peptide amidase A